MNYKDIPKRWLMVLWNTSNNLSCPVDSFALAIVKNQMNKWMDRARNRSRMDSKSWDGKDLIQCRYSFERTQISPCWHCSPYLAKTSDYTPFINSLVNVRLLQASRELLWCASSLAETRLCVSAISFVWWESDKNTTRVVWDTSAKVSKLARRHEEMRCW